MHAELITYAVAHESGGGGGRFLLGEFMSPLLSHAVCVCGDVIRLPKVLCASNYNRPCFFFFHSARSEYFPKNVLEMVKEPGPSRNSADCRNIVSVFAGVQK